MIAVFDRRSGRGKRLERRAWHGAGSLPLFALAVIGALVSGTYFVARLEQQSGQNVLFAAQAAEAAEAGLNEAVATVAVADSRRSGRGGAATRSRRPASAPGVSARR